MIFLRLLFFSSVVHAASIVFIHLGPSIPNHLPVALAQARLFNPDLPIYLIAPYSLFRKFDKEMEERGIIRVYTSSLRRSGAHDQFFGQSRLDRHQLGGFWFYTTERFFYLEELMRQEGLSDVFHLENDVMLYADLNEMLPLFQTHYGGKLGATFEQEERCVAGFFYASSIKPMEKLVQFIAERGRLKESDMEVIGAFKRVYRGEWIDDLPLLPPDYTTFQHPVIERERYSHHFGSFHSLFDAAAIGQYLGGASPIHIDEKKEGYINPYCPFLVTDFTFEWGVDQAGRKIPIAEFRGQKIKINNLHIHSKELEKFVSAQIEGRF